MIPIIFLLIIFLIITAYFVCKIKKGKNIVKDIGITDINKFCGVGDQIFRMDTINESQQIIRIRNHVNNAKFQISHLDAPRSLRINDNLTINMTISNSELKKNKIHNTDIAKSAGISLPTESIFYNTSGK